MNSLLVRRLVMTMVPFVLMGAVVLMAIFGDHGLLKRHELVHRQAEVEEDIIEMQRVNDELRRQIRIQDRHAVGLERMVQEELLQAPPGSTIYRFEAPEADGS